MPRPRSAISISIDGKNAVELPEGSELAEKTRRSGRPHLATRVEIAPREEVAHGHDGGSHWPIFIGPLRPGRIVGNPQVKAHPPLF